MKTIPILVTAVGGDLGQSLIKCLKHSGHPIQLVGCDMDPDAAGQIDCDLFFTAPPVKNTDQYQQFLQHLCQNHHLRYIFPASDIEINFLNHHRHLLDQYPVHTMINDQNLIDTFNDKYHTVEFFKHAGIAYPNTWLPDNLNHLNNLNYHEQNGPPAFPVILKLRRGSGSRNLLKIHGQEELQYHLQKAREQHLDMIIQEYLPGDDEEYTAGIFSDGEQTRTITFKRTLAPGGFSQRVQLAQNPGIDDFLAQFGRALQQHHFRGSLNIQFRRTPRGHIPFEVNPRFSSTVYFRHLFGFRDVQWNLEMREGKPISHSTIIDRGIGVRKFDEIILPHPDQREKIKEKVK